MRLIERLLNVFFPPVCGFCGEINVGFLCEECCRKFNNIKISKIDDYTGVHVFFDEHYYIFKYENEVRDAILGYKFNEKSYLYKTFAEIFVQDKKFVEEFINKYDVITCVPIHKKRMKSRGYNQSRLIVKEIADKLGIEYIDNVIVKSKNVVAQSTLDMLDRMKNIKDAFEVGSDFEEIRDKRVAVFDDVFTTGATVNECAKILKQAGVKSVGIITIAKD